MKKTMILAAVVAMSFSAAAQVEFAPKGGINIATQGDQGDIESSAQTGWNAGLDVRLGEGVIFFQPGVHFYQYNTQYQFVDVGNATLEFERDVKVQSFKIPAQLGVRIIPADIFVLRGNVGPAFNFPINVSDDGDDNFDFDIEREDYKPVTVGAMLGLGVDVAFITFDVSYEIGLSDYVEFEGTDTEAARQNVLTLGLGLRF